MPAKGALTRMCWAWPLKMFKGPEETPAAVEGRDLAMTGGMEVIAEAGFEVIPLLIAQGGAGGRVEGGFYREIRDKIVAGIAAAMPLAGVYLALHGAMLAEGAGGLGPRSASAAAVLVSACGAAGGAGSSRKR